MTLANSLAPDTPNVYNLALFICHLFIDGNFRTGHLLYDPKIFDDRLITEIDLVCPRQIPWIETDITQPLPNLQIQNTCEKTDHTLQLIFFDEEILPKTIKYLKDHLTFYRLIILPPTDEATTRKQISTISKLETTLNSNTIILRYPSKHASIRIEWILNEHPGAQLDLDNFDRDNVFDFTFGKYERLWSMGIGLNIVSSCDHGEVCFKLYSFKKGDPFIANYFYSELNAEYMNITFMSFKNSNMLLNPKLAQHKPKKFHKELSTDYLFTNTKTEKSEPNILNLNKFSGKIDSKAGALYPYISTPLITMFIYGKDFKRSKMLSSMSPWAQTTLNLVLLFMALAAFVLCMIRRRMRLRRDGYISCFMDTLVALISGGNIRVQHKLESWFFGILLIGAFFLSMFWSNVFLAQTYNYWNQKIKTFDQLVEINSPIYIDIPLSEHHATIYAMIKGKLGPNILYKGIGDLLKLLKGNKNSFVFVFPESMTNNIKMTLKYFNREADILDEKLGHLNTPYYLTSGQYVPERIRSKIDKSTSSMMENGLYWFYESFGTFIMNIRTQKILNEEEEEEAKALTVEQLKNPLIILFVCLGVSSIVFLLEITVYRIKKFLNQRQRGHQYQIPHH